MPTIDENTKNVGLGYIQGSDNVVIPLRVNPATNALLIEIIPVGSIGTAIAPRNIPIDENTKNVGAGVTDDSNENIIPLTVNFVDDFPCLRVDVTII